MVMRFPESSVHMPIAAVPSIEETGDAFGVSTNGTAARPNHFPVGRLKERIWRNMRNSAELREIIVDIWKRKRDFPAMEGRL